MPVTLVPREKQKGLLENPLLQQALSFALQQQLAKTELASRKELAGPGQELAQERLGIAKEQLEITRGEAERDLIAQAFKLTKERRDVPGIGKAYIHQEDVTRNLQMLKSLQTTAETAEDDLTTFIENTEEREALKKSNPLIYRQFLKKAQAQGSLTDIEIEEKPVKERPPFRLPSPTAPVLPPTAGPEAQFGERLFGKVRGLEQQRQAGIAQIPEAATGMISRGIGGLGQGYNLLAGATTGATGIPQQTIPPHILDMLRQGQLFQQPFQNIQQTGQALGQGAGTALDFYKQLLSGGR